MSRSPISSSAGQRSRAGGRAQIGVAQHVQPGAQPFRLRLAARQQGRAQLPEDGAGIGAATHLQGEKAVQCARVILFQFVGEAVQQLRQHGALPVRLAHETR